MQLTIDNFDGNGPLDYSAAVSATKGLVIDRKLNIPTMCRFRLASFGGVLPLPSANSRVAVIDDSGSLLFTGYIAVDPELEFAGCGVNGGMYEAGISAVSDEILLDRQLVPQTSGTSGQTIGDALQALTTRVGQMTLSIDPRLEEVTVSRFVSQPGLPWSGSAGSLASAALASYRAMDGVISMTPIGSVVHALQEADGSLQLNNLSASTMRLLANDVTVCGEMEPTAYVTELFRGDGATSVYELSRVPFVASTAKAKPLTDYFQEGSVNPLLWKMSDPSSSLSVASKGLTFKGGNGLEGQTFVASIDQFELGGQWVAEVAGVQLQSGAGVLGGLYAGGEVLADCLAGFRVSQASGASVVTPLVLGADAGATFALAAGHTYTMRTRVYCKEWQRVLQTYRYLAGSNVTSVGGEQASCRVKVSLEIQDTSNGADATVTVLYDGEAEYSPAACAFVPVCSTSLAGSIQSASMQPLGLAWVVGQVPGGTMTTKRMGAATEGADCILEQTGKLRFYPASIPKAGELITVNYRIAGRSVARLTNQASIARETRGQIPGSSSWAGSVLSPSPRSSADCENAASVLLGIASDRNSAWSGTYSWSNLQGGGDIWPGDLLALTNDSANMQANLIVREVRIEIGNSSPTLVKYTIHFANAWADSVAMKLSGNVPADAWIPQQATGSVGVLANLATLTVGGVDGNNIQVQAGINPPPGGGYEIRRRDWAFRAGSDPDLVMRSAVPNFSIPRESGAEQYYIRMYDGSTPPLYSRFSSAIFNNVPL
jgi:hypothetical protein